MCVIYAYLKKRSIIAVGVGGTWKELEGGWKWWNYDTHIKISKNKNLNLKRKYIERVFKELMANQARLTPELQEAEVGEL